MELDSTIKQKIEVAKNEVQKFLPSADQLSKDEATQIIQRYVAAIQGNFVNWMAGAAVSSRSVQARFAAEENIYVEVKDDHPGMLRNFAVAAKAEPQKEHYKFVENEVQTTSKMVTEMSGSKTTGLMATLENTSAVFIPFLAAIAKRLGSNDFVYTDVHGEADIEHADQFIWALSHEQNHYNTFHDDLDEAINVSLQLLKKIFAPE